MGTHDKIKLSDISVFYLQICYCLQVASINNQPFSDLKPRKRAEGLKSTQTTKSLEEALAFISFFSILKDLLRH